MEADLVCWKPPSSFRVFLVSIGGFPVLPTGVSRREPLEEDEVIEAARHPCGSFCAACLFSKG